MSKLRKVLSGGQSGSDVAGLLAAKICGIPTGGTMPRGWITLDGPKPEYAELFGMVEHTSPKYPPRTECNVMDSDATIRIAFDFGSAGERLTKRLVDQHGKLDFAVDLNHKVDLIAIAEWLNSNEIETLNVAGNSHRTNPAVGYQAFVLLTNVFTLLGHDPDLAKAKKVRERFTTGIYKH